MPGYLVTAASTLMCPHAGPVTIVSENETVLGEDGPLCTLEDVFIVQGCPQTQPGLSPCMTVAWLESATRVFIEGVPALLTPGETFCDGVPPGPATVVFCQSRVWGT